MWSYDGNKVAYISTDDPRYDRIAIYDIGKGSSALLTDDTYVYEQSPSWSFDSGKIAFISDRGGSNNVWIKDINSGSLTQATNSDNVSDAKLSPDGTRLAYFETQILYIVDLANGNSNPLLVDDNTDWYSIGWSPDGNRILFVSYAIGNGNVFIYDLNRTARTQITDTVNGIDYVMWSPNGNSIVFAKFEPDWSTSIWVTSSNAQDQRKVLSQNLSNLNYLSWVRSGGIACEDQQSGLNIVYPQGIFQLQGHEFTARH